MKRYPAKGPKAAAIRLLYGAIVVSLLLLCGILWISSRLKPVVSDLAAARLTGMVREETEAVLAELEAEERSYALLTEFQYDGSGDLAAVSIDLAAAGKLESTVTTRLTERLASLEEQTLSVPLGSLSGIALFAGRGVRIPVSVQSVVAVKSDLESQLTEVGINQMLHRINMTVTTDVTILTPGGKSVETVTGCVPLAEGVIFARVPESYTYFVPDGA